MFTASDRSIPDGICCDGAAAGPRCAPDFKSRGSVPVPEETVDALMKTETMRATISTKPIPPAINLWFGLVFILCCFEINSY